MITRHFYRFDEVRAALLYAIMKGRPLETAFWLQELVDTALFKQAWATLVEAWLWFSLATDPNWPIDIRLGTDAVSLHLAAYRLCTNPKDNSLWATLLTSPKPDTLCANVPTLPYLEPCLERYLSLALFQRKGAAAMWAAHRLPSVQRQLPATSQIVPSLLAECGLTGSCWSTVSLSAQILFICARSDERPVATMPLDLVAALQRWSLCLGRRSRRVFAVPQECLYGLTERGRSCQTETTVEELRHMEDVVLMDAAWFAAAAPFRSGHLWNSDEAMEAFYATYFPDDIPDEWSREEALKSHGHGLLRTGETASLQKIGRIWFQAESRFVWGFYEWPADLDEKGGSDFCSVARHLNTDRDDEVAALLDPVRKLVIAE
jgi:hypothetical protein